jgi:hypothetical protein
MMTSGSRCMGILCRVACALACGHPVALYLAYQASACCGDAGPRAYRSRESSGLRGPDLASPKGSSSQAHARPACTLRPVARGDELGENRIVATLMLPRIACRHPVSRIA